MRICARVKYNAGRGIKMVKIAVLGFGTVGSGVVEVIGGNHDKIAESVPGGIEVKYIVDVRSFPGNPYEKLIVKDFSIIENDPEVTIVVETIGGKGVAFDFTKRSLIAGKSVVTSNKALVADHGYELIELARQNGVNYLFEASVGGGIPVLLPLTQCLAGNRIEEIFGILNGTTNYILTEMIKNGLQFGTALKQAQSNGYAEANPADDIEGHDACRKISILSTLAFGRHVYPESVPTEGITSVTLEDVAFAAKCGYKIKLISRTLLDENGKICAYVAPHLLKADRPLAGVEGVMNAIVVKGDAVGNVMFYGAGAGKMPTASAVVGDVIDAAKHCKRRKDISWKDGGAEFIGDADDIKSRFYVRTDKVFVGKAPFDAMSPVGTDEDSAAYITDSMSKKEFAALFKGTTALSVFRILD